MSKKHVFLLISLFILSFNALPTEIDKEIKWQKKNAGIKLSTVKSEVSKPDSTRTETLVLNVEQVQKGQNLPIKLTEEVEEYGDDSSTYLLLLLILLGVPVIVVV